MHGGVLYTTLRRFIMTFVSVSSVFIFAAFANAEIKTIEAENLYLLGDNDSKNDGRRISIQEAKRNALEQAGTYVAGLTQVKEYRLTKDEITAYTAGILETEIVSEEMRGTTQRPEIYTKVRCKIDTDTLMQQIDRYRENHELRQQLEASAKEMEALRKERDQLQKQLALERDKPSQEETRGKLNAVLSREESIDATNRVWAKLSPKMDFYSGKEINKEVSLADLEDSALILEKAAELNPKDQRPRIMLAALYEQKGDRTKAEEAVRKALMLDQHNPLLHLRLGILLRESGKYKDALGEFRSIEHKRPNHPPMLFQTGLTYRAMGNCRLAVSYLKRMLQFTKRNNRPEIERLKIKAHEILQECGKQPQPKPPAHRRMNKSQ